MNHWCVASVKKKQLRYWDMELRVWSVMSRKKAEHWRIDAFELCCCRRLLRVPWTTRRSNPSILKEINPEYLLEGLMLKLQYFGHLIWRANSLENDAGKDWRQEEKGKTEFSLLFFSFVIFFYFPKLKNNLGYSILGCIDLNSIIYSIFLKLQLFKVVSIV